jgi:predicted amidohydrolase
MEMEKNYQKAAAFIKDAASQGAELALLPECTYTSKSPNFL